MKTRNLNAVISLLLAMIIMLNAFAVRVYASGSETAGRYISDVYMAYGKTEEEAVKWLTDNGWEPIKGDNDFNAGKASYWDDSAGHRDNVAVAMGIKRTNDAQNAITDMAVMNMSGGYSFPAYKDLLKDKKAEIDEFINTFIPVIREFRENFANHGSSYGKKRADIAYQLLNKLYDGEAGGQYAVNDTGMHLGDLFLAQLRQEGNDYGGDLQQILLESSGAAVTAVEQLLILAADTGEDTWIERLQNLSGDKLVENISHYIPDTAGQDLAPSAITNVLNGSFGDTARKIADGWSGVHDDMIWYENYNETNDLWQHDGESDEDYAARISKYFEDKEQAEDDAEYRRLIDDYSFYGTLYNGLYEIAYEGEWGETLGDFFNPADGSDYSLDPDNFLTFAAVLSPGQKSALDLVTLSSLLMMGLGDEVGLDYITPDLDELLKDDIEISVYSGINRAIFRDGVAITSQALMEQNMGRGNAFDRIWDHLGIVSIVSYVSAVVGVGMMIAGGVMMAKGVTITYVAEDQRIMVNYRYALKKLAEAREYVNQGLPYGSDVTGWELEVKEIQENMQKVTKVNKIGYAGRAMLAIGGVLLIAAAFLKIWQMKEYYNRDFTVIPLMIVDESDIVTYLTDENGKPLLDEKGNQLKNIDFKDYEYYDSVKCNRQIIGVGNIGDPQDGVDKYAEWGCGDVADLNADMGQEWLALYTVKSPNKGNPILADSLKLQYGSDSMPSGCNGNLHFFEYTYAADLGDTAYAYNNKKGGVYFFWQDDPDAYNNASTAASVFTGGHLAIAAAVGLLIGALGATLVLVIGRKKKTQE